MTERSHDDDPLAREAPSTRKAVRRPLLREEVWNYLFLLLAGAVMLGLGGWACWMTLTSLRRGYIDEGDSLIYAAQEPGWFYGGVVFLAAMGLFSAYLGAQMLWYARDESRITARPPKPPAL
jgi:uncharacterized membrane protein